MACNMEVNNLGSIFGQYERVTILMACIQGRGKEKEHLEQLEVLLQRQPVVTANICMFPLSRRCNSQYKNFAPEQGGVSLVARHSL